jgi:hypothetical protein
MTVPILYQKEFLEFLKSHGFEIVSNHYWNDFDRVIFQKDGETFPFPIKEKYMFPIVCRICDDFGIEPPEDHRKFYDQFLKMQKREPNEKTKGEG